MILFFTLLFVIVGVNAVMLMIRFNGSGQKSTSSTGKSKISASEIYPLNTISSKYKKAV